jgi:hypothetical protein
MKTNQAEQDVHAFTAEARAAIYQTIFSRRDVRGQFLLAGWSLTQPARVNRAQ